jgi:hypothetical protein
MVSLYCFDTLTSVKLWNNQSEKILWFYLFPVSYD